MARRSKKSDVVRVGIVGVGIGRVHARGYGKCPNAQLVALCDIDADRARRVADEFGVASVYSDYETMIAEASLDALSVCTPNALHAPVAVAALGAGIHVLCEKPLASSAAEGAKIVEAARKSKALFMVGMNNRFRGDTQVLKGYAEGGELGEIYYARCGWVRRYGIPGMGGWFTRKATSGGGSLIDIGVHALDLTLYLMGSPRPASVFGATYAKFGPEGKGMGGWGVPVKGGAFDVEDLAAAQVRFDNGATLTLEASWAQHCAGERLYSEVYGTQGGATLEPLRVFTEHHGKPVDILPQHPEVNGHEAEVAHFVDCIVQGRQPLATVEQAQDVMKILDGIYESARTGASVAVK
ncbi:MAG: Gfo/Idh/MocA family oxidoreductase [Chthonomonadales bacterium]|nr:Gfo/Idh/MocA family oxidoreductase [Chthonomonadales bacterium]